MRKQIAAANWKMNLTLQQAETLIGDILSGSINLSENQEAVFGIPFPYLVNIKSKIAGKQNVLTAAQNCSNKASGAYTGEVSAEMIKSIGVPYVIIGHSERREYFKETNATLAEKVGLCFEYGLKPIFCCGEALEIREAGAQNEYVENQLKESLFHLTEEHLTGFVIAYEPIWAIGTGKTATSLQAQEMHAHIRNVLAAKYSQELADSISILYGGSVKATNAKDIFGQPDVDGGLVGGSSLVAAEFSVIINSLKQ
ncbi:MAG: triose-phosphate isomerase [Ferruginibacter sp.]